MSFFGEDDHFSFLRDRSDDNDDDDDERDASSSGGLHNNYRDRSYDDDDESDASSSDGEEDDEEQSSTYAGVTPQSPVFLPDSPSNKQGDESQEDSDGEPSRETKVGGGDFYFLFDGMEPSKSLEEEESDSEYVVQAVECDEDGEAEMTSFVSLLENCFEGTSEEGGRGRGNCSFEDGDDDEESVGVVAEDTSNPSGETPNTAPSVPFSVKKILRDGLSFAGFTDERIDRCGEHRNVNRFKAHYGVCPETLVLFFGDLFKKHPSVNYKNVFMTLFWLKTYSVAHVMASTWGFCEEYINPVVEEYIAKFSSLKDGKIRLDRLNGDPIIVFSIDACHFMVDEFALSPSTRWYDHKKGAAGLTYEVALSIHTNEIIWIRGPLPASVHDISMFRGQTTEDKKNNKVDKDAFIFHIPDGKKGVGDSGCK